MLVYWLLFAGFALSALFERNDQAGTRSPLPMILAGICLALVIGLRFEVGGDWGAYKRMFALAQYAKLEQLFSRGDPAYEFLNFAVRQIGAGIWLVNLICGAIFTSGLIRFARTQANPWAVMLVATPYLVIVVAMGYTRQGVAIGILMAGLAALLRGALIPRFAMYVVVATLFHKTAIVALLLVLLSARRNFFLNLLFILAAMGVLYDTFIAPSLDTLMRNYVGARYNSQGALIRVAMITVPALMFLAARKRFEFNPEEDLLWRNFAYAALLLATLLAVSPSSTAVDRLALYVLPLQLAIIARVPGYLLRGGYARVLVVTYAFAIQYVWLNFATHSAFWLPFQFYPFES